MCEALINKIPASFTTMIKIEVLSRLEAGEILCTPGLCAEITYLVSIGDGDDPLPEGYENAGRKVRWVIADVVTEEGDRRGRATNHSISRTASIRKRHSAHPLRGRHQSLDCHGA